MQMLPWFTNTLWYFYMVANGGDGAKDNTNSIDKTIDSLNCVDMALVALCYYER